jgi:hypothetical protein
VFTAKCHRMTENSNGCGSHLHTDSAHCVLSQVLSDLEHEAGHAGSDSDLEGVQDRRKRTIELQA